MWRPGLEVVGTIVLLELLARGGVKGGQNQGKVVCRRRRKRGPLWRLRGGQVSGLRCELL